jgi:hypothetical protein
MSRSTHPRDQQLGEGQDRTVLGVRSQRPTQGLVVLGESFLEAHRQRTPPVISATVCSGVPHAGRCER